MMKLSLLFLAVAAVTEASFGKDIKDIKRQQRFAISAAKGLRDAARRAVEPTGSKEVSTSAPQSELVATKSEKAAAAPLTRLALSRKGSSSDDDDDGDDDEVAQACEAFTAAWSECLLKDVSFDDDWFNDDDGDDDDDDGDDGFGGNPTCAEAAGSQAFKSACASPIDACEDEYHAFAECLLEGGFEQETGRDCDFSCDSILSGSDDDVPEDAVTCPGTEPGGYCDCDSDCTFAPANCACDEAAAKSCCDYPAKCEDNPGWHKKNRADEGKDCSWVKRNRKKRCETKGVLDGTRGNVKAKFACNKACKTPCRDSTSWFTTKNEGRNCLWVSNDPKDRCDEVGGFAGDDVPDDDDMPAWKACPSACDGWPF